MAKRNKLGIPRRKRPGTHYHRPDWQRGTHCWYVAVPLTLAGDAPTFTMAGAVPDGDRPGDPRRDGKTDRWRVDVEGRSFPVYARWLLFTESSPPPSDGPSPYPGETFVVFQADRKCSNGPHCPLAHYWSTDIDFTLSRHLPGACPAAVAGPGTWKRDSRITLLKP